jgi:predicted ATPase
VARCRVFQFHDTSVTSHIRAAASVENSRFLLADGGNVAAILYRLQNEHETIYRDIVHTLRLILPWFADFELEPEGPSDRPLIRLRWRMAGHADCEFVAGQLSDGSLRTIALVTFLHLPEGMRPSIIILDEPELGLHPSAEKIVAGLIRAAAIKVQVILSTQSATLVDCFEADDVVVVEAGDGQSSFSRQSSENLAAWLKRYTLGQVWNKNLIGSRP